MWWNYYCTGTCRLTLACRAADPVLRVGRVRVGAVEGRTGRIATDDLTLLQKTCKIGR